MKIACLQLNPSLGQVENNIRTADSILAATSPASLELLVLPELAFTGYNFPSVEAITPHLEPTTAGPSTRWAIATAKRLKCHVIVGYPERSSDVDGHGVAINYNATVTIGPDGTILATYRKSHLYYTDEVWAAEGSGFFCGQVGVLGTISHGICMDINQYQFSSPWEAYEFANHSIKGKAPLIVLSTAWLTHATLEMLAETPEAPDLDTIGYWHARLRPLTELAEGECTTVVFANRIGTEVNENRALMTKKGQVVDFGEQVSYAGSSCVMQFVGDKTYIFNVLGKAEEGLLVVDTEQPPKYSVPRKVVDVFAVPDQEAFGEMRVTKSIDT